MPLKEFILFSHDRGDSVAPNFLQLYQESQNSPFRIRHQFLTNANMYLPLANLTDFQKVMLDPATSVTAVGRVTPKRLAVGIGASQYSPPLGPDDPEVRAMTFNFAWQDGVQVIPETIQYLNERKKLEVSFLEALSRSAVPVTLMWGVHDMVSPIRVADYVWSAALKSRKAPADYWLVPCAYHYLVHDQAQDIARVIRLALGQERPAAPANLAADVCAPVLVERR